MSGHRLSDHGAGTGHEVVDAGRQRGLGRLCEDERAERRELAGLVHDRASGSYRRGDLRHGLEERVIPRSDRRYHADRALDHQGIAELLLERLRGQQVGGEADQPQRARNLDGGAHPDRGADFRGDQGGQLVGSALQGGSECPQLAGPGGGRRRGPAGQRGAGGRHRGVHVLAAAGPDRAERFLRAAVLHGETLVRPGRPPLTADQHGVPVVAAGLRPADGRPLRNWLAAGGHDVRTSTPALSSMSVM
jgi:hypothetical protein